MKKKLIILSLSLILSTSALTACGVDNNELNDRPEDVNYQPTRYDQGDMNYDNRDRDMDRERRVRQPGERDTPYNMDEEEPDLDEEPSEQRRERDRENGNY
ncbi:hypothetical protein LCL89_12990 [Halobacillus yeomjeoni]|uniref:Lipoprotein n=1 Tax=Halobacillus yeomjeoni TaxID=311194 RepID=A0A931HXV9_9BACI|nr:hypothetical protein [Halobacillus yeomjeoni]MBH0231725.1 hypothetical protein [Halobacillus yeomjeoni]MCA0984952.1 hypothetical protein [Halobacillus yeomjeoni]